MPSERIQRQIDRLLDAAEQALEQRDWAQVREYAQDALRLDPENADARAFVAAAQREPEEAAGSGQSAVDGETRSSVGEDALPSRAAELHADPRAPATSPSSRVGESPALPDRDAQDARREPILRQGSPEPSRRAQDERGGGQDARAPSGEDSPSSSDTRHPAPDTRSSPVPTPDSLLPTAFVSDRYKVIRFLGEGGKKQVYLAHDSVLDRDVAFALIKTEGLDQTGRDRITREGQAMGRLGSHPHVVTVFDLGDLPAASSEHPSTGSGRAGATSAVAGQPYMVTELMKGGDVEGLLEKAPEHRLPLEQALRIADEVCQGLEFAHSKGIVHRDLKPGNVWLTEGVGSGE